MTTHPGNTRLVILDRHVRLGLAVVAAMLALMAALFVLQVPLATGIWPYGGRTQLSNIFIGSIFLAAAASMSWCLVVGSDRGFAGIAMDGLTIFGPFAVFSFATALGDASVGAATFGVISVAGAIFSAWLLRWSLRHRWRDPRPVPRSVLASFIVFAITLVIVGGLLVLQVPGILPWRVTPQLSTLFGLMFLGASAYFIHGIVDPRWENAGGQLAGFLAYDAVLIVPLAMELLDGGRTGYYDTGSDQQRVGLVVYTAVVTLSGLLAIHHLLVRRATRPWTPIPVSTAPEGSDASDGSGRGGAPGRASR